MPKPTFNQIKQEKRERLLAEAAKLFAERGFEAADVAELANRAGISKGSIYNYFASKDELYIYVCTDGLARSRQAVYGGLDPEWDPYRQVEHIFLSGARFAQEHPEYVKLYLNVSAAGMERFTDQLSAQVERRTAAFLKDLIRRGQADGAIRLDLDPRLAALFINSLYVMMLASLVSKHFQIRLKEYLEMSGELTPQAVERPIQETIDVVKQFLRPASQGGTF